MRSSIIILASLSPTAIAATISTPNGYTTPLLLNSSLINAPYDIYGYNTYMGLTFFPSSSLNIQLCADACSQTSSYSLSHPPPDNQPAQTCQFFNTYLITINNTIQGQHCAMYSQSWPASSAVSRRNIRDSYISSNLTSPGVADPNAAIYQASKEISYSKLQPFCSSYVLSTTPANPTAPSTTTPAIVSMSTPAVLTKYPSGILWTACSLQTSSLSSITSTSTTNAVSPTTSTTTSAPPTPNASCSSGSTCVSGTQYSLICDADFDLSNNSWSGYTEVSVPTYQECMQNCNDLAGCNAFSFNQKYGVCYAVQGLKSTRSRPLVGQVFGYVSGLC